MTHKHIRFLILFLAVAPWAGCKKQQGMIERLMVDSGKFNELMDESEKHRIQIIYTQIDRDEQNGASFKTYGYRLDKDEYFYPASTVKLPAAALAIEKINDLSIQGFTTASSMYIDSAYSGQSAVYEDSSSQTGRPSIAHYIKKVFLVSDNDAFNRLYEFLGQQEFNSRMIAKGFTDVRFTHRLSLPLTIDENRHTNPMRFYSADTLVYQQEAAYNEVDIKSKSSILMGKGYMKNGVLVNEPMDFSSKNAISLQSLHDVVLRLMFPENFLPADQFSLGKDDYQFLYEYMSKYPGESDFPNYGDTYPDGYCKFLLFGGAEDNIDRDIRVYNKVGEAYGFLIDIAYVVDFEKKIEFILGSVIYVNENEIFGDDTYEYELVGFPFMRDLGQVFYEYESARPRTFYPDLSKYNWKLWQD